MKSMMKRTTFREIKHSLGRYLAIFAIVALGVVMFAGLKVCKETMVDTGNRYLSNHLFYDYRLLSTIGFEQTDAENLKNIEGVAATEGSVSLDVLQVMEDGSERVVSVHTLLDSINTLELVDGRLPEKADEIVLDRDTYPADIIGSSFVLSANNKEDTLDLFAYDTYQVVGLVQSPYYLNYERGTSSIGNGVVTSFAYIKRDGFDSEYDTEIFLRMNVSEEIYSDAYNVYIETHQDEIEKATQILADERFSHIYADALSEIADAEQELLEKTQDAQKELDQALLDLEAAEEEVASAKTEISDGEEEIEKAWEEIASKEKEIATGKKQIASARSQLEEGITQLTEGIATMDATISYLSTIPDPTYQAQCEQLKITREESALQLAALTIQLEELNQSEQTLLTGEKEIAKAKQELAKKEQDIADAKLEIEEAEIEIADGYTEYEDGVRTLEEEVADANEKIADAKQELADLEEPSVYVLDRDANVGYVCFDSDSSIVDEIAAVFPIFFFAVAALVCMTTMTRMVEDQRTQIGVLKALGYGEFKIMGKYMFYAGSAAVGGAIFGFVLGTILFPKVIWVAYGMMYGFAEIRYVFDPVLAIISLVSAVLCSVGATYFSCASQFLSVPAALIRPKAPKSGKRILLERIPFIWKHLKFLQKVSIRNVFRYKKRFVMMVLGISGCTALLVTALGLNDSIKNVVTDQYDEISTYQLSLTLAEDPSDADTETLNKEFDQYLSGYVYLDVTSKNIRSKNGMKSAYVVIPQNSADLVDKFRLLDHKSGKNISYPSDKECVLTEKMARKLGVRVGDEIMIEDSELNQIPVTVSGICKNYVYSYVFINADAYVDIMKEQPHYKTVYANFKEGVDEHKAASNLGELEQINATSVISDMKERFTKMMSSLNYVIIMVVICAAALAFIVLYNLTNINITERIREIATIKVLGFYPNETAQYVFRENFILTFFGALFGLLLGKWLHLFVMNHIDIDVVCFGTNISFFSFTASIVLTFVFAGLVNLVMYFKLNQINMAESLKSIE